MDELWQTRALSDVVLSDEHSNFHNTSIKKTGKKLVQKHCFGRGPDDVEAEETGNQEVNETYFYSDAVSFSICGF